MAVRVWIPALLVAVLTATDAAGPAAQAPAAPSRATSAPAGSDGSDSARALLNKYCVSCHNDRLGTADVTLQSLALDRVGDVPDEVAVWEKVVRKLRSETMPPPGRPRPEPEAYAEIASWLEASIDRAAARAPDPGRPVVHRLNRAEYTNAVRDLLDLEIDGRSLLPPDDSGYGFDNIADVLSTSPSLLERYLVAATKISRLALGDPTLPPTVQTYWVRPTLLQHDRMGEELPFGSRGGLAVTHYFPVDGTYDLKIRLQRTHANQIRGLAEPNQVEVRMDRARVATFSVGGDGERGPWSAVPDPSVYELTADEGLELRLDVEAGEHLIAVTFPRRSALPEGVLAPRLSAASYEFAGDRDAPMSLDSIRVTGPYDARRPDDTPARRRLLVCAPQSAADEEPCAARILSTLARRAFRRPVAAGDVAPLLDLYREGRAQGGFEDGIERALRAVLVDPEFLFRVERDPAGVPPATAYRISELELASRLSFFLWSSIPDEELLGLAERGALREPATLRAQVARMLADRRAGTLVTNFADQWLHLRNIRSVAPDPDAFPEFDDNLRDALRRETQLFVESQIREDRSVRELLTADYTYLNERLARHYGIAGVHGNRFRRVPLDGTSRGGLLGQGSILTVTSYPNRTSPTLRGKWVLENLLGAPPPAPPANVPDLSEGNPRQPQSLRERLAQHRENPVCASCHAQMDPLGLALEPFDAVGKQRSEDGGAAIDASATLPGGSRFVGPPGLREFLAQRPDRFASTVVEKLLTYALGRGLEPYDAPAVRRIVRAASARDYRWSSLVEGIVESVPFQMRRSREP